MSKVIGKNSAADLTCCTYHSFALKLCRTHAVHLPGSCSSDFLIFTETKQKRIVKNACEKWEEKLSKEVPKIDKAPKKRVPRWEMEKEANEWMRFLGRMKAEGKSPEDVDNPKGKFIYETYTKALVTCNAVDFSCFVDQASELLKNSQIAEHVRESYKYIIVDEFQVRNPNTNLTVTLSRVLVKTGYVPLSASVPAPSLPTR